MCWELNQTHFDVLRGCKNEQHQWRGLVPSMWAEQVTGQAFSILATEQLSRQNLQDICEMNSDFSDEEVFLSTMAWGGMRRDHGRDAWASRDRWKLIVSNIRTGALDRQDAYTRFSNAHIPGLAPAYFTKLIYFCLPAHNGYILDQWTGKSINLLFQTPDGQRPIQMQNGWVTRNNTADHYETFCTLVERLANELHCTPAEAEMRIFSNGGHNAGQWRQYARNL